MRSKKCSICGSCEVNIKSRSMYDCYDCTSSFYDFSPNSTMVNLLQRLGWEKTNKKAPVLISAFPACGKTYMKEKFKGTKIKVVDLDSSAYPKDGFPENYIQRIKEVIETNPDYILVSTHMEVIQAIIKEKNHHKARYFIAYPDLSLKDDWIQRLKDRGNNETFVNLIDNNYNDWIKALDDLDYFPKFVFDCRKKEYNFLSEWLSVFNK